ncbi:hypothetical protein ACA910_007942 [Epithemia clementina (nom. ined.)]
MNGAKYATFNIDSLDFDYGGSGGSSSQENQPLYHGPQDESYDPSAAPQTNHTLHTYSTKLAPAPGMHSETQQQQRQNQQHVYLGRVNDYQPRDQAYLNPYAGASAAASAYGGQHHATISQYQHSAPATTSSPSPFDPLPMSHIPVNPSSSNVFEDFIFSALMGQSGPSVDPLPGDSGTYSTVSSSPNEQYNEPWMNELKINVSTLSLEPLSGSDIVTRLQMRMDDVISKFLPCVDFLVQCQQDLRKGLVLAQRKVGSSRRYFQPQMTPRQFWAAYVEPLPQKFMLKNQHLMDSKSLNEAVDGLERLRKEAKASCETTCEAVKNSFLGGMKEGESWGLRKWLSRHGNALAVCTDLECILKALKALDRSSDSTKKLAELLRPIASRTLARLKKDVPASYQERSSAHPYLPFFHRLESALRDMSQFDPNDDGVICLDDSDDESDVIIEVKPPPKREAPVSRPKRNPQETAQENPQAEANNDDTGSSSGSDEECEVVEIVGVKQPSPEPAVSPTPEWKYSFPSDDAERSSPSPKEPPKKRKKIRKDDNVLAKVGDEMLTSHVWPTPVPVQEIQAVADVALRIAAKLDDLAQYFREHREAEVRPMIATRGGFWNGERYADALSIFGSILRRPESAHFVENPRLSVILGTKTIPVTEMVNCLEDLWLRGICGREVTFCRL